MDLPVKQMTFCKSYEKKDLPKKKKLTAVLQKPKCIIG